VVGCVRKPLIKIRGLDWYGLMAIGHFLVLPAAFGRRADALTPEFW
jgi:hypothetical protein